MSLNASIKLKKKKKKKTPIFYIYWLYYKYFGNLAFRNTVIIRLVYLNIK